MLACSIHFKKKYNFFLLTALFGPKKRFFPENTVFTTIDYRK